MAGRSRFVRRAVVPVVAATGLTAVVAWFLIGLMGSTGLRAAVSPAVRPGPEAATTSSPGPVSASAGPTLPPLAGSQPPAIQAGGGACSGSWQFPDFPGPALGWGGPLLTFRIAVEAGVAVDVREFSLLVDGVLGDPRSWVGAGDRQLRHVAGNAPADFTIHLACPWTAYALCRSGGVDIRVNGYPFTSCRVGNSVVINSDRFLYNGSAFTGSLTEYRYYLINHEVGHRLGHDHAHCPGSGQFAPVMQQQTLRMEGCVPNGWPYPFNPPAANDVFQAPPPPPTPPPAPPSTEPAPPPGATEPPSML